MDSRDIPSPTLFVEIHSTELHKNRKSWRQYDDETSESRKKQKVNTTFEVDEEDDLNDGLIETIFAGCGSEKAPVTNAPLWVPNLSLQCTESVNIGPADTENTQIALLMGQMENEDIILCDREGQSEAKSLFTLNTNAVALVDPLQIQNYEFDQGDNVEYYAYLGTFEEANEGYAVALDDDFLEEDKSVDSYSAFCREAHLKPHCSELELSLNEPKVLDANTIAQMTSTELTKKIQMHARALASLLRETNERTKLRQSLINADEAPVAEFVAGSFRNNALYVHLQCGSTSS